MVKVATINLALIRKVYLVNHQLASVSTYSAITAGKLNNPIIYTYIMNMNINIS